MFICVHLRFYFHLRHFIVKMMPGRGAFDLVDLRDELEQMLGCKVDLITEHRWMRERVKREIEAAAVAP